MYAAVVSRPDIAHAVNKLAQYSSNPSRIHWNLAKCILQFLYHTRDRRLTLGGTTPDLYAYSDADFAGDVEDRKPMGGYAVFLGDGTISWSSKKQSVVALSSTESEYITLSEATRELLWTRRFLHELGLDIKSPMTVYQDNEGTIAFARNQKSIRHMKHIDTKYHFVRFEIEKGSIRLDYKCSADMIADIFTKFLPPSTHARLAVSLGLTTSPLEGE